MLSNLVTHLLPQNWARQRHYRKKQKQNLQINIPYEYWYKNSQQNMNWIPQHIKRIIYCGQVEYGPRILGLWELWSEEN